MFINKTRNQMFLDDPTQVGWTEEPNRNGQGTTSSAPAVAPAQLRHGAWPAMRGHQLQELCSSESDWEIN